MPDSRENEHLIGHSEKAVREYLDYPNGWFAKAGTGWELDPDLELSPTFNLDTYQTEGFRKLGFIDLSDLDPGDVIFFLGYNPYAFYTLKIFPDQKVKTWRDSMGRTTGLTGYVTNISVLDDKSIDWETKYGNVYYGCLAARGLGRTRPRFMMPYFEYEGNKVLQPNKGSTWQDFVQQIYVRSRSPKLA